MVLGKYCFDEEAFSGEAFEVGAFLEDCRSRSPMETIHQDLKQFQTALENQLVAIINEDYAEFLQLSSKLKGVDEAVSSVRAPILAVLKRVDEVHSAMSALQNKIQAQIQSAGELQQQEADLQLSIKISEKLLLLEELLDISSADSDDEGANRSQEGPIDSEDSDDEFDNFERVKKSLNTANAAEGCAKLERAAQIFVQLDLEFLNGMHLATIQREEKRLAAVEDALLRRLETEFATEIFPDTFYNRDHTISAITLSYLLRAYVLLNKSHIPEEMVGRLLVQPFAEENITRGKLDGRVRGSCEGLPQIYESILDFISNKFSDTLSLAVCQGESKCSVDILGNAVWKPLQEILSTKHAVIFQAADPERFHQNYTISMRFLDDIQARFCRTEIMRARFRSHESVVEFKEKWNIDVYFQLRATQLASSLEKSFGVRRDEPSTAETAAEIGTTSNEVDLSFENSAKLWQTMQECWSDKMFLPPLLPNFCKLCMQLFTYYINIWKEPLLNAVAVLNNGTKVDFTAVPLYFLDTDEDLLYAGSDFHLLRKKISHELLPVMKTHVDPFTEDSENFVAELFQESIEILSELEAGCWSAAVTMVAAECKKVLPALRTVKGQYQMTNKPPPTTPSSYVSNIIQPVQTFLEKWGTNFDSTTRQQLLQSIAKEICDLYSSLSSELLRSAMELEESLKSRKMQRHLGSSAVLGANAVSDTEKMRMQLLLDLQQVESEMQSLGLDVQSCSGLQAALAKLAALE